MIVFEGVSNKLEPYKITADKAVKTSQDLYKLTKVNVLYQLGNKNLIIDAVKGTIDDVSKQIELKKSVTMNFENITLTTNKMLIDLINKNTSGNSPLFINYKNSKINADTFFVNHEGYTIHLDGNVVAKVHITDF